MQQYSGTLRTRMRDIKPDDALRVFSQILDGVEAAHLANVWHRDLKPENILWNERDGTLVIADFGIALFEEEETYTADETKAAARMANFLYSAPEQRVRGQHRPASAGLEGPQTGGNADCKRAAAGAKYK